MNNETFKNYPLTINKLVNRLDADDAPKAEAMKLDTAEVATEFETTYADALEIKKAVYVAMGFE